MRWEGSKEVRGKLGWRVGAGWVENDITKPSLSYTLEYLVDSRVPWQRRERKRRLACTDREGRKKEEETSLWGHLLSLSLACGTLTRA